jgi:uncharacterized protein
MMSAIHDTTRRVLLADNPWLLGEPLDPWFAEHLCDPFVARHTTLAAEEAVTLVVGPRQAGKSTLIWHTQRGTGRPFLYLNGDEPSIRAWLSSPALFLEEARALTGTLPDLFFEEVQRVDEPGLFLKGLADRRPGVAIFATGSSSFELEAKTRESLAGRALRAQLLPFSLEERGTISPRDFAPIVAEEARRRDLEGALVYGGFPRVVLSEDPQVALARLVEAYVIRDASDRFRIRHLAAFRKVLELAASQIGSLVNLSEWAAVAGVSNDTVADYVAIAESTHVLKRVHPFVGGRRAELTARPKVYFVDNGIRNQLFGGFPGLRERADRGALMENLVLGEIMKSMNPLLDTVRYWRTKSGAEVDFVVEHRGQILAVEVKAGDPRGRVTRSARSFIEAYRPSALLVVSMAPRHEMEVLDVPVRFIRPWEVMGEVRGLCAG